MNKIIKKLALILCIIIFFPVSVWSSPVENPLDVSEEVVFSVGKYYYKVGGQPVTMDATSVWNNSRETFLIPLRSYANLLRYDVHWNEEQKIASISKNNQELQISLKNRQGHINNKLQPNLFFEIRSGRIVLDASTLALFFDTPYEILSERLDIAFTIRRLDALMPAPDFTLPALDGTEFNLYNTLDREDVQLVAINFYSTFCPFCIKEIPNLVRFNDTYLDKGVVLVGIDTSTTDTQGRRNEILEHYGVEYPILIDLYSKTYDLYRVSGIPNIFFINQNREIIYHHLAIDDHHFPFLYQFVDSYLEP